MKCYDMVVNFNSTNYVMSNAWIIMIFIDLIVKVQGRKRMFECEFAENMPKI